jgi:hypothetical protein
VAARVALWLTTFVVGGVFGGRPAGPQG